MVRVDLLEIILNNKIYLVVIRSISFAVTALSALVLISLFLLSAKNDGEGVYEGFKRRKRRRFMGLLPSKPVHEVIAEGYEQVSSGLLRSIGCYCCCSWVGLGRVANDYR